MTATRSMFKLVRPCAKCPFRTDVPGYLRRERAASIARDIAEGSIFHCHETTVPGDDPDDPDDLVVGPDSQFCAGALLVMEADETPNQAVRMAERIGLYAVARMDRSAPVHPNMASFVRHHDLDGHQGDEPDCCSVVDAGCEAPAGYMVNGVAVPSYDGGEVHECPECGEHVCDSCSDADGYCRNCRDET